eukprot:8841052-Pyramimonas_sp.AAC.1
MQNRMQNRRGAGYEQEQERISATSAYSILWCLLHRARETGKLPLSWICFDACRLNRTEQPQGRSRRREADHASAHDCEGLRSDPLKARRPARTGVEGIWAAAWQAARGSGHRSTGSFPNLR